MKQEKMNQDKVIEGDPGHRLLKVGITPRRGMIEAEIRSLSIGIEGDPGQDLLRASITKEAGYPPEIRMKVDQNTEDAPGRGLQKASFIPVIEQMKDQNVVKESIYHLLKVGIPEQVDLLQEVLKTMTLEAEGALGQSQQKGMME